VPGSVTPHLLDPGRPSVARRTVRLAAHHAGDTFAVQRRLALVAVAALGAWPSVLWAVTGCDLISDDWVVAAEVRRLGVLSSFRELALHAPGRPGAAAYYAVVDSVLGVHPVPRALLVAALNAGAAVLVLLVAERLLGRRLGIVVALVWAALPNRGSARLWFVLAPDVLALCGLLVGVLLLTRNRIALASAVFAAATLAYEAVVVVAAVAIVVWWWSDRRDRLRPTILAGLAVGAAALTVYALSPKEKGTGTLFAHTGQFVPAQLGIGLWGDVTLTRVAGVLVLAGLAASFVRVALPSFRRWRRDTDLLALAGLGLVVVADVPFFVAGFPFATDGIFDRGNIVAGVGVSLLLGSLLARAVTHWRALALVTAVPVVLLAVQNAPDVRDYRLAVRDGHVLTRHLEVDGSRVRGTVLVGPPLPNRGGVAQFILSGDLAAAMELKHGAMPATFVIAESEHLFAVSPLPRYDRRTRTFLSPRPECPTDGCATSR
jgi:hypothetical protein